MTTETKQEGTADLQIRDKVPAVHNVQCKGDRHCNAEAGRCKDDPEKGPYGPDEPQRDLNVLKNGDAHGNGLAKDRTEVRTWKMMPRGAPSVYTVETSAFRPSRFMYELIMMQRAIRMKAAAYRARW